MVAPTECQWGWRMDLEDSDEDPMHSTSSSTDSDYSLVDMDDDE